MCSTSGFSVDKAPFHKVINGEFVFVILDFMVNDVMRGFDMF